VAETKLKNLMI